MDFEDVLNDIDKLVGMDLESLNPQTGSIRIAKIDYSQRKYIVKSHDGKSTTRYFSELEKIWDQLKVYRAINVESVLEGGGSSRNQPETILANLAYVDHFKYKRRKHLYLQSNHTHALGSLNELLGPQLREVKRVLDSQSKFDRPVFYARFKEHLSSLTASIEEISVKYPGEFQLSDLKKSINELRVLQEEIEHTVIEPGDAHARLDENEGGDGRSDKLENEDSDELGEPFDIDDKKYKELDGARIRHQTPMFSLLFDRMRYEEIELQPNFQRRDRIWSSKDKSALVESILIGLPIPNLYFAERKNGHWVVIDGLQRLTTLKDYMEGEFCLSDLGILDELNGLSFSELSRHYQRKFREYTLYCHIISIRNSDDDLVKALFQRINTYGKRLSYQEIRCALYVGTSVPFLRYIAEDEPFKLTTFGKIDFKRMRDMEHVLGAVAFILFGYERYDHNRFDRFLGQAMQALNKFKLVLSGEFLTSQEKDIGTAALPQWREHEVADIYNELKQKMEDAFSLAEKVFGDDRYQKNPGEKKVTISKPLFELIVAVFANLTKSQSEVLTSKKEEVRKEFREMLEGDRNVEYDWESEAYIESGRGFEYSVSQSTGKRVTILFRFKNFKAMLEDVLGEPIEVKPLLEKYADWDSNEEEWVVKGKYADQCKA